MSQENKILVVDDIEVNRAMLTKIFSPDYTVLAAENGRQAMEILREQEIKTVLLDLSMPVMDGYEVIEAMKADRSLAAIPIVVTTGVAEQAERRAFELGADDFVTKPYDPYVVRKRVENLMKKYVLEVENLRQALGQAEQLNHAKNDFLSRMSHDLRSPVNSVISLAGLIHEDSEDGETVRELSDKITESSKYMLGVISDILDVSAIENEKIVITRAPFDFRRQMESIAAMFYGACRKKNINFDLSLSGFTEEYLFGDPLRLKEVLVNLVSNAVKFTPEGGHITVRVRQLSRVAEMVKLRFEVADDGEGIAEDRLQAIFEPYTQESETTVQTHGGSGLGLSIVKNIVELMGGQVSVQSTKGKGSVFTLDLPFTVSKEVPAVGAGQLKNVRALLVDDDEETQAYGQKMMAKLGIGCDIADTGEQALAMMRDAFAAGKGYDICFVDWRMPGMDGIEITKAIRTMFDDDTVIVVASAYDLTEIEQEAKMAGANVVVPKPMFQSTVFDLLMNVTGGNYRVEEREKPAYNFAGKRILLAEDNNLNAEIAERILQAAGFAVDRAENGKTACEQFEASPAGTYAAILMDIQMPLLNGHDAARRIRAGAHTQAGSIPIVAVTANAFTKDVRASLEAGMNEHIAKPIEPARLYAALDKLVGQTAEA